jgi:hypothetical protein
MSVLSFSYLLLSLSSADTKGITSLVREGKLANPLYTPNLGPFASGSGRLGQQVMLV